MEIGHDVSNRVMREEARRTRGASEEARRRRLKMERRKKRRRQAMIARGIFAAVVCLTVLAIVFGVKAIVGHFSESYEESEEAVEDKGESVGAAALSKVVARPLFEVDLLTVNEYSRPGYMLPEVKSIFVHYTANPGTSARQNRSYFENLKDTHETSASAHFVIGYEGEIIQCIPLAEVGYAVMQRNYDSVSIECCYLDEDGKFTDATYNSLVNMLAWLITKYELMTDDILRHYDEGGKACPKYYVDYEGKWDKLKQDVADYIQKNGSESIPEDVM